MFDLEINQLCKRFGETMVVDHFDLQVQQGELISLLGPSGCGKTTVLRMVTGFLQADEGDILIRGKVMNRMPSHRRDIAMVYQNYALFPHMTVAENVAFGLRMRHKPESEIQAQVKQALEMVHLTGMEERYPIQLSGGQQQRVALARAIAVRPAVMLLDEPLSNLDAKLRLKVRVEIRELQQRLGTTTIFVTHDQEEALSISDRVVVMNRGQIEQIGTPTEIYERPCSNFVMGFVGSINLLRGQVVERRGEALEVRIGEGLCVSVAGEVCQASPAVNAQRGANVLVGVRPEKVVLSPGPESPASRTSPNTFPGTITAANYLGAVTLYRVQIGQDVVITIQHQNGSNTFREERFKVGEPVLLSWDPNGCILVSEKAAAEMERVYEMGPREPQT